MQANSSSQGINYDMNFANGSLRPTRLLITTLHVVPIASKERTGFSEEVSSPNGDLMVRFCGSTENVRSPDFSSAMASDRDLLQRAPGRVCSGLLLSNAINLKLLTPRVSSTIIQDVFPYVPMD